MIAMVAALLLCALQSPVPLEAPPPTWPADVSDRIHDVEVSLLVSIDKSGKITAINVSRSGGESFDRQAILAVSSWKFLPARRDGEPIDSRAVVPLVFVAQVLPQADLQGGAASQPTSPQPSQASSASLGVAQPSSTPTETLIGSVLPADPSSDLHELERPEMTAPSYETSVHGHKQVAARAASDFVLSRKVLDAAPLASQSSADLLTRAPGMYVARGEGDAVAHQLYLRGFDAEHGQDIELTTGHVPINQISHLHGQGYADLNFIIPELVRAVRVTEGVYDPRQGDFAVAGSADFDLGVPERGYRSKTQVGSFGTVRQLVLVAPEEEREETFLGLALRRSDGFGRNRASLSGALSGQYTFVAPLGFDGVLHVSAYGARAALAGVLRREDVLAKRVGFYDAYPDASANAQSAFSGRGLMSLHFERSRHDGLLTFLTVWLQGVAYASQQNFTGYTQRSRVNPDWIGRGDLIEQRQQDLGLGVVASHRTRRYELWHWLDAQLEFALNGRVHRIEQAQNLLQVPDNQTWDQRIQTQLWSFVVGGYMDLDVHVTKYIRLRGGVRADSLFFDIDDKLGNFIPSFQRQSFIVGYRRQASGLMVAPRASLTAKPMSWLDLIASYGEGYRSPQARLLDNGENAPFSRVRSMELGGKVRLFGPLDLTVSAAGYVTWLGNDLAFDPAEGRLEKVGPTSRKGFALAATVEPLRDLLLNASFTFVHATLDAPPVQSVTNPVPAYVPGQLLPYVPPVVARLDASYRLALAKIDEHALSARAGLGFSFLSQRPLPYGRTSDAVALLDASLALSYRWLDLGVEVSNLTNSRYAAVEYSYVSNWQPSSAPSLLPARHLSAGAPLTVLGTLGVQF